MNTTTAKTFKEQILEGIPAELPQPKPYDTSVSHAPKRKDILTKEEKILAVKKCLTLFSKRMARRVGKRICPRA